MYLKKCPQNGDGDLHNEHNKPTSYLPFFVGCNMICHRLILIKIGAFNAILKRAICFFSVAVMMGGRGCGFN